MKKKDKPFPLFLVLRHDSIDGAEAYKVKGHRNGEREARCRLVLTGVQEKNGFEPFSLPARFNEIIYSFQKYFDI